MRYTSTIATAATVFLSCSAAVTAQRCNPVTELNGDDSITITGLGSTPDYTIAIEQDGTPISTEFLEEFCSVVTTACSEEIGDALEREIAFCVSDSEEFISYTMAELEEMVDAAQEAADQEMDLEQPEQPQQQTGVQNLDLEDLNVDPQVGSDDTTLDVGPQVGLDDTTLESIDV